MKTRIIDKSITSRPYLARKTLDFDSPTLIMANKVNIDFLGCFTIGYGIRTMGSDGLQGWVYLNIIFLYNPLFTVHFSLNY